MQDIEEEPELRQQIDLYRDDDIIKQLEGQLAGMELNEKSKQQKTIDAGKTKVGA